jgi:hypothetical protein
LGPGTKTGIGEPDIGSGVVAGTRGRGLGEEDGRGCPGSTTGLGDGVGPGNVAVTTVGSLEVTSVDLESEGVVDCSIVVTKVVAADVLVAASVKETVIGTVASDGGAGTVGGKVEGVVGVVTTGSLVVDVGTSVDETTASTADVVIGGVEGGTVESLAGGATGGVVETIAGGAMGGVVASPAGGAVAAVVISSVGGVVGGMVETIAGEMVAVVASRAGGAVRGVSESLAGEPVVGVVESLVGGVVGRVEGGFDAGSAGSFCRSIR